MSGLLGTEFRIEQLDKSGGAAGSVPAMKAKHAKDLRMEPQYEPLHRQEKIHARERRNKIGRPAFDIVFRELRCLFDLHQQRENQAPPRLQSPPAIRGQRGASGGANELGEEIIDAYKTD